MPYKVTKSGSGYKVKNKKTGKTYSKKSLPKKKAMAQMRAIYANTNESFERQVDAILEGFADITHGGIESDLKKGDHVIYHEKNRQIPAIITRRYPDQNDWMYEIRLSGPNDGVTLHTTAAALSRKEPM